MDDWITRIHKNKTKQNQNQKLYIWADQITTKPYAYFLDMLYMLSTVLMWSKVVMELAWYLPNIR